MKLLSIVVPALLAAAVAASAEDVQGLVLPIKQASVATPVLQEVIEAVPVKEGDDVKEGTVLIQLRNRKEELAVDEAKKLVENAEFVAKGMESLAKEKMGSKEQALKSKTELELAKIKLAMAEELYREKTVRAPLSGTVVKVYKEPGESIDRAEKLVDIINIDQVWVQFYLDPRYMQTLQVGQEVPVRFAVLNNAPFTAKVDFIDPRIDASSGLFRVKLLIDNPDHKIKAGMRCIATFGKGS